MNIWKFFPLSVVFYTMLLSACTASSLPTQDIVVRSPAGEDLHFTVEIADSEEEQRAGLMYRETLPAGHGMLFVYAQEHYMAFWMKNTRVPLDILYFDAAGSLVSWTGMVPCIADPCPTYPSADKSQYALEVPAGTVDALGIHDGWELVLE